MVIPSLSPTSLHDRSVAAGTPVGGEGRESEAAQSRSGVFVGADFAVSKQPFF